MKFEDLSPADQALVNTNFGELDKVAEEMVKEASECYERGFEKTALEIANGIDKAAEEEKEEKEEKEKDEGQEKKAEQLAAFYERGVFDGLEKLGMARHGDPMHYFWPFVEEKVAEEGARAALDKLAKVMEFMANAGRAMHPRSIMNHARRAVAGERTVGAKAKAEKVVKKLTGEGSPLHSGDMSAAQKNQLDRARKLQKDTHLGRKERAMEGGKAALKGSAYVGAGAAAGVAAHKATKKD